MARLSLLLLLPPLLLAGGCPRPPTPPPALAAAGQLTDGNFARERVDGPATQGLVGDYFLRNDKVRAVIQAPGRAMGPCPWGGNVIDLDLVDKPQGDQLGEVSPFLQLGRTVNFTKVTVLHDGSDGGAAVIVARGPDEIDDFINIVGLASFTVALTPEASRPTVKLGLDVTATYTLAPGDSFISIVYSLHNPTPREVRTSFGTLNDTGARIEVFHPGVGYGEFDFASVVLGNGIPPMEYVALQAQGSSYGIIPIFADRTVRGAALPVAGVAVEVYDQLSIATALNDQGQTLVVPAGGTVERTVVLAVAPGGAGAIEGVVRALKKQAHQAIKGVVREGVDTPVAGARIAISDAHVSDLTAGLITTFVADGAGEWAGELPTGDYVAQAEGDSWQRSAKAPFTVTANQMTATVVSVLPSAGRLRYRVRDDQGHLIPAKVFVLGKPSSTPDRRFRDTVKDPLPYGVVAWLASRSGDSGRGNEFDHPISLPPGSYRVVISRGPEWSRFESQLELTTAGALVDATLYRVVDTVGYVACDFHQHSHISPDSPVTPAERIVAYLADGVEFLSSSEHDVVYDYAPVIDSLDAGRLLDSGIGIETTPFDYGHFIAFPLKIDPLSPNGGALDWGNAGKGDLTPGLIFDGLRAQGAEVLQVNHPRTAPGGISFQQNFDRAALRFDFALHTYFSDVTELEVSPTDLGLPDFAELFSPKFNSLEVYNGFFPTADPASLDGERVDVLVDRNLRDWMNFNSIGLMAAAVGDSDSHSRWSAPSGIPRTMVRVKDDGELAIGAGVGAEVVKAVSGAAARDVVVTNGPMLRLRVGPEAQVAGASSIGKVVALPMGETALPIHVEVQAAEWAPFDTVEIFANETFTVPVPKGNTAEPLLPALCFTSRATPSWRCKQALGGAQPLVVTKVLVGGGPAARWEATVDASPSLASLAGRVRAGAVGQDLWVAARVLGRVGLFPVIPVKVDPTVPLADILAGVPLVDQGVPSLAFTNAVLVDVDGNGWRAPFAP